MAFIGNLLNPSQGAGFQAQGTNAGQYQGATNQVGDSIAQQKNFLNALAAQNGIGNQQSVFNQLQGVANGTGPNPAQAMLNQATGANVSNQAALQAGQRGASANPGLIARNAALAGTNAQQQAVGQGATMQANQSLGALGQLGGIAGQQVGEQQGALSNIANTSLTNQSNLGNMLQNQNNANAGIANTNAGNQAKLAGGLFQGAAGLAGFADGGTVPPPPGKSTPLSSLGKALSNMFSGMPAPAEDQSPPSVPLPGLVAGNMNEPPPPESPNGDFNSPENALGNTGLIGQLFAKDGGKVPAMVSPGEKYLNPKEAKEVKKNPNLISKKGEIIPGKAKVSGDSYANDTVRKELKAGGIVIPRSVMQSKDAPKKAAAFVAAHLARGGMVKKK